MATRPHTERQADVKIAPSGKPDMMGTLPFAMRQTDFGPKKQVIGHHLMDWALSQRPQNSQKKTTAMPICDDLGFDHNEPHAAHHSV